MIIILGFLVSYVGLFLYAMEEYNYNAYNLDPPDPDTFLDTNSSRLYAMAMWYERNIIKYHMPQDMIVMTYFNSSKNPYNGSGIPESYSVTYDSCEWTGHYLMAEAFRYAVHVEEGNISLADEAKANIKKALRGVDKVLHVSGNGGMARYAWPIDEYPGDPDNPEDPNHYRGEWNGTEYIFEDDTSRDMHNGIIMGLGFAYLMVDDEEVRDYVKELVEDLLDYLINTGWLYLKPTNDPNGTDLNAGFWLFGTTGMWTLAYLKVGALVNPDKYEDLYEEYAIERDYVHRSAFPYASRMNVVQSYYGLLLDWEVLFTLITLEDDESLRSIYLDYIESIWNLIKYDRTAQFNAMWLIMNDIDKTTKDKDEKLIIADVEDCLMRYYGAPTRLPGRNVKLDMEDLIDATSVKWVTFFKKGWGSVFYPFYHEIYQFEIVAKRPLTPDERQISSYLWQDPPYRLDINSDTLEFNDQDGRNEEPSVDYIAVYWPCRYYDLIDGPSDYNATIEVNYPGD